MPRDVGGTWMKSRKVERKKEGAAPHEWGRTALYDAAYKDDLALVKWLVDTQGADANGRTSDGDTALTAAFWPLIVRFLLARHADPTLVDVHGVTTLMHHAFDGHIECIACLVEDERVVDCINAAATSGNWRGSTALHIASRFYVRANDYIRQTTTVRLLLEAGADPRMQNLQKNLQGHTPVQLLRGYGQVNQDAVRILEEILLDEQRAAALLHLRRLAVKKQGVELREQEEEEEGGEGAVNAEEGQMLAFVVGLDGRCPRDVFTVVMDLLLPLWAPLRKGLGKK